MPQQVAGHLALAPEVAKSSEGFKPGYFAQLAALEGRNFWFRSRNRLIVWALQRYFPTAKNFLEIGCGTGFVLSGVEEASPDLKLFGSEVWCAGLAYAAERVRHATLFQMDARTIPFESEFDVIGAFDVLEHIEQDNLVLSQMYQAVSPGGGIIITVPHHRFLWSQQDEYACHVRRYKTQELKDKVAQAGFEVIKTTSFVSLLLPLMMISRLRKRNPDHAFDPLAELRISGLANAVLENLLNFERALIRWGFPFPVGGSLLLVARKP